MVMNEEISAKVIERAPAHEIGKVAKANGLRLLRDDGWVKVRQGFTTPEEVVMCTAL
jgi:type IV pilus assembly protein PilB